VLQAAAANLSDFLTCRGTTSTQCSLLLGYTSGAARAAVRQALATGEEVTEGMACPLAPTASLLDEPSSMATYSLWTLVASEAHAAPPGSCGRAQWRLSALLREQAAKAEKEIAEKTAQIAAEEKLLREAKEAAQKAAQEGHEASIKEAKTALARLTARAQATENSMSTRPVKDAIESGFIDRARAYELLLRQRGPGPWMILSNRLGGFQSVAQGAIVDARELNQSWKEARDRVFKHLPNLEAAIEQAEQELGQDAVDQVRAQYPRPYSMQQLDDMSRLSNQEVVKLFKETEAFEPQKKEYIYRLEQKLAEQRQAAANAREALSKLVDGGPQVAPTKLSSAVEELRSSVPTLESEVTNLKEQAGRFSANANALSKLMHPIDASTAAALLPAIDSVTDPAAKDIMKSTLIESLPQTESKIFLAHLRKVATPSASALAYTLENKLVKEATLGKGPADRSAYKAALQRELTMLARTGKVPLVGAALKMAKWVVPVLVVLDVPLAAGQAMAGEINAIGCGEKVSPYANFDRNCNYDTATATDQLPILLSKIQDGDFADLKADQKLCGMLMGMQKLTDLSDYRLQCTSTKVSLLNRTKPISIDLDRKGEPKHMVVGAHTALRPADLGWTQMNFWRTIAMGVCRGDPAFDKYKEQMQYKASGSPADKTGPGQN
jgi:hypothetical protein